MIYYVEDDNSIRELVIYTLSNTGFEALGLDSGVYRRWQREDDSGFGFGPKGLGKRLEDCDCAIHEG